MKKGSVHLLLLGILLAVSISTLNAEPPPPNYNYNHYDASPMHHNALEHDDGQHDQIHVQAEHDHSPITGDDYGFNDLHPSNPNPYKGQGQSYTNSYSPPPTNPNNVFGSPSTNYGMTDPMTGLPMEMEPALPTTRVVTQQGMSNQRRPAPQGPTAQKKTPSTKPGTSLFSGLHSPLQAIKDTIWPNKGRPRPSPGPQGGYSSPPPPRPTYGVPPPPPTNNAPKPPSEPSYTPPMTMTYDPPRPQPTYTSSPQPQPSYVAPMMSYDVPRPQPFNSWPQPQPQPSYGPPQPTHEPPMPQPTYGAPQPQPSYGPPQPTFMPPNPSYGPPQPTMGTPRPSYGPPQPTFMPPNPSYGPPQPTMGTPRPSYGPPQPTFMPPNPSYGPPQPTMGTPRPSYGPPQPTFMPPNPSYGPPQPTMGTPRPSYGPPQPTMLPPNPSYGPPQPTMGTPRPTQGYGAPQPTPQPGLPTNPAEWSAQLEGWAPGPGSFSDNPTPSKGSPSPTPPILTFVPMNMNPASPSGGNPGQNTQPSGPTIILPSIPPYTGAPAMTAYEAPPISRIPNTGAGYTGAPAMMAVYDSPPTPRIEMSPPPPQNTPPKPISIMEVPPAPQNTPPNPTNYMEAPRNPFPNEQQFLPNPQQQRHTFPVNKGQSFTFSFRKPHPRGPPHTKITLNYKGYMPPPGVQHSPSSKDDYGYTPTSYDGAGLATFEYDRRNFLNQMFPTPSQQPGTSYGGGKPNRRRHTSS